jgi:hypothetical protein
MAFRRFQDFDATNRPSSRPENSASIPGVQTCSTTSSSKTFFGPTLLHATMKNNAALFGIPFV